MKYLDVEMLDEETANTDHFFDTISQAEEIAKKQNDCLVMTEELAIVSDIASGIVAISDSSEYETKFAQEAYKDFRSKLGLYNEVENVTYSAEDMRSTAKLVLNRIVDFIKMIGDKISDLLDSLIGEDTRNYKKADDLIKEAFSKDVIGLGKASRKNWGSDEWSRFPSSFYESHQMAKFFTTTRNIVNSLCGKTFSDVIPNEDIFALFGGLVSDADSTMSVDPESVLADVRQMTKFEGSDSELLDKVKDLILNKWHNSVVSGRSKALGIDAWVRSGFEKKVEEAKTLNEVSSVLKEATFFTDMGYSLNMASHRYCPMKFDEVISALEWVKSDAKAQIKRKLHAKKIRSELNTIRDSINRLGPNISTDALKTYLAVCKFVTTSLLARIKLVREYHTKAHSLLLAYCKHSIGQIFPNT